MKTLAVLGIVTSVACATLAQEDPVETRRIPVAFLLTQPEDTHSVSLGLAQDSIGTSIASGPERRWGLVEQDELVAMLKKDVAPASWTEPGISMKFSDETLVAVNRRSVLDAVSAWLARARARHGRRIVIDAALVVVPFERWGTVAPRELAAGATLLKSARLMAGPGQRVHAQDLKQLSYIRDHDVQISTSALELDPIMDVLNTGVRIDLRPLPAPGGEAILFEVRSEAAAFLGLEEKTLRLNRTEPAGLPPAVPAEGAAVGPVALAAKEWQGLVQLPSTTFDRIRGQVLARPGETVVAAAASRADGILALLLTPTFAGEAAAAEPAGATTRLYDISALSARVQDWAAPRVELVSPQAGGGGPLTGATFTLDEPKESYGDERVLDDIRALVDPAGTPTEQSAATRTASAISVRADAARHAAVDKRLAELFRREVRVMTTEAAVLSFKGDARSEWAKTVSALAPGGDRATDADLARLFEEARKGKSVRLAGFLSIPGRPGQRVHVLSGRQQAYVQDFEPQVSTLSACYDPIIGVLMTGSGLEATPTPRAEDGTTNLRLRAWIVSGEMMTPEKRVSSGGGPVQRPKTSGSVWQAEVVCAPGYWTLAALESRGEGEPAEEVALFVRVR